MTEWWEQILQGGQDAVQTVIGAGQQAGQVVTDQSQRVVQSIQQAPQQVYDFGQQVTQPVVTPIVNTLQSNPQTQTVRPLQQQTPTPQQATPLDNTPVRGRGAVTADIVQGGYRQVTGGLTDSLGWVKYPGTKQSVFPTDRPGAQNMGFDKSGRSLEYGEFSKWGGGVSQLLVRYGASSPEASQKQIDRYGSVLDNPRADIIAKTDAYINRFGWSANKAVVEHPENLVVAGVQAVALEPVFGVASAGIEGLAVRGAAKMGASAATQLTVRSASKYVLPAIGVAVIGGEVTKNDKGMWFSDFSAKNTSLRGGQIAPSVAVFAGTSMALSGRSFITEKTSPIKITKVSKQPLPYDEQPLPFKSPAKETGRPDPGDLLRENAGVRPRTPEPLGEAATPGDFLRENAGVKSRAPEPAGEPASLGDLLRENAQIRPKETPFGGEVSIGDYALENVGARVRKPTPPGEAAAPGDLLLESYKSEPFQQKPGKGISNQPTDPFGNKIAPKQRGLLDAFKKKGEPSTQPSDYFKGYRPKAKPDIEGGGSGAARTTDGFGNTLERGTPEDPFAGYKPKPKPDIEGGGSGAARTTDGFGNQLERGSPAGGDNPFAGYKQKPKPDIPGGGAGEPTVDGFGETILKRKPTQTIEEYNKMMNIKNAGLKQRGDIVLENRAPAPDMRMLRPSGSKTRTSMGSFGKSPNTKGVAAFKQTRADVLWEEMAGRTSGQKQPTQKPIEEQMFSWMTVQKQKPAIKYDMGQVPIERLDQPRISLLVELQKLKTPPTTRIGEPIKQREKTILGQDTIVVPRPTDLIQKDDGGGGGVPWGRNKPFPKIGAPPMFGGGFGGGGGSPVGKLKRDKWSRKNKTAAALPGWYFKDLDASKGKKRGLAKAFDMKGSPF